MQGSAEQQLTHQLEKLSVNESFAEVNAEALVAFLDAEREGAVLALRKGFCSTAEEARAVARRCAAWAQWIAPECKGALEGTRGGGQTLAPHQGGRAAHLCGGGAS